MILIGTLILLHVLISTILVICMYRNNVYMIEVYCIAITPIINIIFIIVGIVVLFQQHLLYKANKDNKIE